jgi:hypothetical protein
LFIQILWGGIYMDPEIQRPHIERAFKLAGQLREKMALAHRMGLSLPGRRLIAVVTMSTMPHGWGWLPAGDENIVWHETEDGLEGALQEMIDLIAGQSH